MGGHKVRGAVIARKTKKRSVRQRCPLCKKLRKRWFRANELHEGRVFWQRLAPGAPKVCHICVARIRCPQAR